MPDLKFAIESVEALTFAVAPTLRFKLRVENSVETEPVYSVALRCQIQIETPRRHYQPEDHARLLDLFGEPERWSQTLRSMLWTFTSVVVPPFTGSTTVDMPVTCTYDFNVASAKYFYALEEGEVPVTFLFSGTVFYEDEEGALQVAQISWEREAPFRLPVKVWKEMMDHYYPNSVWLALHKDAFDRLYRYKMERGFTSWEQALDTLLDGVDADVAP